MKVNALKGGEVIVLQRDVQNPEPDRRRKSKGYMVTWPRGTRLLVKPIGNTLYLCFDEGYDRIRDMDPAFVPLVQAAEPAERNLVDMCWAAVESNAVTRPRDILQSLVELGMLTLDQVQAGIDHNYAKEMAREDA